MGVNSVFLPSSTAHFADCGELVVLDVRQDEYLALGPGVTRAIRWAFNPALSDRPERASHLLEPLIRRGLIMPSTPGALPFDLPSPAEPGGLTVEGWFPHLSRYAQYSLRPRVVDVFVAGRWLATACRILRRSRVAGILRWLYSRAESARANAADTSVHEVLLSRFLGAHIRARMIYPPRVLCLAGSAALAAHCWSRGLPVSLVIGVQKYPFFAHAWVQYGETVVNDVPEPARKLAPIVRIGPPPALPQLLAPASPLPSD